MHRQRPIVVFYLLATLLHILCRNVKAMENPENMLAQVESHEAQASERAPESHSADDDFVVVLPGDVAKPIASSRESQTREGGVSPGDVAKPIASSPESQTREEVQPTQTEHSSLREQLQAKIRTRAAVQPTREDYSSLHDRLKTGMHHEPYSLMFHFPRLHRLGYDWRPWDQWIDFSTHAGAAEIASAKGRGSLRTPDVEPNYFPEPWLSKVEIAAIKNRHVKRVGGIDLMDPKVVEKDLDKELLEKVNGFHQAAAQYSGELGFPESSFNELPTMLQLEKTPGNVELSRRMQKMEALRREYRSEKIEQEYMAFVEREARQDKQANCVVC